MSDLTNAVTIEQESFRSLLGVQSGAGLATDDVLVLMLPLFKEVTALHAQGRVAGLDPGNIVLGESGALRLRDAIGEPSTIDVEAINRVQPLPGSALNIVGELRRSIDTAKGTQVTLLDVQPDPDSPIERPVYLPGFVSWEIRLGHHDEITDVFRLGLMLACIACGLDFDEQSDLENFATHRRNLFRLNERLHPIIASVIVDMTALNRHDRATDLAGLSAQLEGWRDQPIGVNIDRALADVTGLAPRRTAVLSHLRDRLFDLSRRNRLLYFRPNLSTVNLTVASVPLVLQLESIRPEHICTWSGPFAHDVTSGQTVSLQRWLRFEDQPYLPVSLDRLIQETQRDLVEYGFSHLRLVVAFLRWHNLKESPEERITTPLLWLPVKLGRRKGVRDQYTIECADGEAEFNPVLRHYLHQLYDIRLPEVVDLQKTTIAEIHADILRQIRQSEPAVELRLIEKPSIKLVRQKAVQRMQQFQRRRAPVRKNRAGLAQLAEYSYEPGDYRPLGQALFEKLVRPSPLQQRFEAGAPPQAAPRHVYMTEDVQEEATERLGYELQESEGHRYAWDLDLTQVTLANFNYRKMSLVRDYTQLLDEQTTNQSFDRVFSIEPRHVEVEAPAPISLREQWNVIVSDATQNTAVNLARSQRSFIIQGPPGTGKSQTITNLIADYAGRGQRVLFVCEKRAALDVVFHRLKQSGLDELCCLIHDSQTDKKAFIADLRKCYERWMEQPDDAEALLAQREDTLSSLVRQLGRIEQFEAIMGALPDALGCTVRELVRRIVELPEVPADVEQTWRETLPTFATWQQHRHLAHQVSERLRDRFGVLSLAQHPFGKLSRDLLDDVRAFGRAQQLTDDCDVLFGQLDAQLEDTARLIDSNTTVSDALAIARESQVLIESHLAGHLALLEAGSPALADLEKSREELAQLASAQESAAASNTYWREKLSPGDTESALGLVTPLEASLTRWFNPTWWRLRGELKRRYDFSRHAVQPTYTKLLTALQMEHQAVAAVAKAETTMRGRYGVASMASFLLAVDTWRRRTTEPGSVARLVAHLRSAVDPVAAAHAEAEAREPIEKLVQRMEASLTIPLSTTLGELAEVIRDLRESLEDLPDLLPTLRAVYAADAACAEVLRTLPYAPNELEALIANEALKRMQRETPAMAQVNGRMLAGAAQAFVEGETRLLEQNAKVVHATLHRIFKEHVRQSSLSATQLDAAGKDFKKRYATGRRELEHEFAKSMRYRSIRDLASDETGTVINDLKPIWLMSPLSVSDTLPLATNLFDVVIFDEASQIPTEEAVPALCRANQVVIVGDEMQLPPTSFFTAAGNEDASEIVVEEEGERISINLDADSLLNQAARNLPATLLAWHYRSRHESLISFSNAAFYDGSLVTIPDSALDRGIEQPVALRSDQEDSGALGTDAMLARPISFHQVDDGLYMGRQNIAEARYIAAMTRDFLRRETGLSLGIVAFSEAQQSAIEDALDALAANDIDFATRLEREYVREDDEQFNGLFVKNLENVQGDERDVIILSVCYARGPDGKMLMNFGPINQRGGEKRLNVIFSRARHRMAVVSTIRAEAITNIHNDGAAALRTFLQFAEASAHGQSERSQIVLSTLSASAKAVFASTPPSDAVRHAMLAALRQRGHIVHEHVGRSQFRCDLAIVDPDGGSYALAILLDAPTTTAANVRERYVFRPNVLRKFGWKVLDVPGKDWIENSEAVLARIEACLAGDIEPALVDMEQRTEWTVDITTSTLLAENASPAQKIGGGSTVERQFRFEQGASRKFWRIALTGMDVMVTFGRIGTKGQSNLKTFATLERARREVEKLVDEKLKKGYIEDC